MADDELDRPRPQDRDRSGLREMPRADRLAPAAGRGGSSVPWGLVLVLVVAAALAFWFAWNREEEGDPLAASLIALERQNKLTVFSAQLAPVVSSRDERLLGLVKARQVAVIPARVDYTLDLSGIDADDLDWDAETQTLTADLPAVTVGKPNLDEARAQYLREGVWIGRDAQDRLTRTNTRTAEKLAREQAANPVLVDLATDAARAAITQNLSVPLQVAGYEDVQVVVRFAGEPKAK